MTRILVSPDLLHRLGNDFEQATERFHELDFRLYQSLEPVMAEVEVRRPLKHLRSASTDKNRSL